MCGGAGPVAVGPVHEPGRGEAGALAHDAVGPGPHDAGFVLQQRHGVVPGCPVGSGDDSLHPGVGERVEQAHRLRCREREVEARYRAVGHQLGDPLAGRGVDARPLEIPSRRRRTELLAGRWILALQQPGELPVHERAGKAQALRRGPHLLPRRLTGTGVVVLLRGGDRALVVGPLRAVGAEPRNRQHTAPRREALEWVSAEALGIGLYREKWVERPSGGGQCIAMQLCASPAGPHAAAAGPSRARPGQTSPQRRPEISSLGSAPETLGTPTGPLRMGTSHLRANQQARRGDARSPLANRRVRLWTR